MACIGLRSAGGGGGWEERKKEREGEGREIMIGHLSLAFLHNKVFVGVSLHLVRLLSSSMICSGNHSDADEGIIS
jgi:hypothetical protein